MQRGEGAFYSVLAHRDPMSTEYKCYEKNSYERYRWYTIVRTAPDREGKRDRMQRTVDCEVVEGSCAGAALGLGVPSWDNEAAPTIDSLLGPFSLPGYLLTLIGCHSKYEQKCH